MSRNLLRTELKQIVGQVRRCKTAEEERKLVARECARLRDRFSTGGPQTRCVALTKLLYFYVLGYPAHFGQLECLALVASSRFIDKRVGYLGCMMLIDENADIHVLLTNSIQNDLKQSCPYIQGLALCALASIVSSDMARALAPAVGEVLKSSKPILKQKAALCANRLIEKAADVVDIFIPHVGTLVNNSNISVKMCGCTLAITICSVDSSKLRAIKELDVVSPLRSALSQVLLYGALPEYCVHNVPNPFIRVKIFRLFSLLGRDDYDISSTISDVLAQTLTDTTLSKNAACAILYECCLTVFSIESTEPLMALALRVLADFLSGSASLQYVALSMLLKIAPENSKLVSTYRDSVFACINNSDIAIKKRALEFLFCTIDKGNVAESLEHLMPTLLNCESSLKQYITSKFVTVLENFPPEKNRCVDAFLFLLEQASQYLRDDSVFNFLALVSNSPELQKPTLVRILRCLKDTNPRPVLAKVACWVIGQYGHLLLDEKNLLTDAIGLLNLVLKSDLFDTLTRSFAMSALMKLTTSVSKLEPEVLELARKFSVHLDPELQQRSVEWIITSEKHSNIRPKLMEETPPIPLKANLVQPYEAVSSDAPSNKNDESKNQDLIDMMDIFSSPSDAAPNKSVAISDLQQLSYLSENHRLNLYDKNCLKVYIEFGNPLPGCILQLTLYATNQSSNPVSGFDCQISVPSFLCASLGAPSTRQLLPYSANSASQSITINNPQKKPIKLRIKLTYEIEGQVYDEVLQADDFPQLNFYD